MKDTPPNKTKQLVYDMEDTVSSIMVYKIQKRAIERVESWLATHFCSLYLFDPDSQAGKHSAIVPMAEFRHFRSQEAHLIAPLFPAV